jgi:hypothetical protein
MSESESEDEILDRIEAALRRIAGVSPAALSGTAQPGEGEALDRAVLTEKLDGIISKLRDGLVNLRSEPGA